MKLTCVRFGWPDAVVCGNTWPRRKQCRDPPIRDAILTVGAPYQSFLKREIKKVFLAELGRVSAKPSSGRKTARENSEKDESLESRTAEEKKFLQLLGVHTNFLSDFLPSIKSGEVEWSFILGVLNVRICSVLEQ